VNKTKIQSLSIQQHGSLVLFVVGLAGQLSECLANLLKAAEVPVKLRSFDSASDNRRLMAYEFSTLNANVLHLVTWCTIHINHAITSSGIKQMGAETFNSLYSCSLLLQIGGNFYQIVAKIPVFVRDHVVFKAEPPPTKVDVTETVGYFIMGLGYLDDEVFTDHPRGIAFLKIFCGDWWDRNIITIFNVKSTMEMFELANLPG